MAKCSQCGLVCVVWGEPATCIAKACQQRAAYTAGALTNIERYGPDHYRRIGAMGPPAKMARRVA